MSEEKSFFKTLPGIITAITGLIVAITSLIKVMGDHGLIEKGAPIENVEKVGVIENTVDETPIIEENTEEITSNVDAKTSEVDQDLNTLSENNLSNTPHWKNNGDGYIYLYVNNQNKTNLTSAWDGNNLVVFDKDSRTNYFLQDFYIRTDNQLRETKAISTETNLFWKHNSSGYAVYFEGKDISSKIKSSISNNDKIIYFPENNKTYILSNFENTNDENLKNGIEINSKSMAFYRRNANSYWIYYKGEVISANMNGSWINDTDFLTYNKDLNLHLLLENYTTSNDNKLRAAKLLESKTNTFWKRKGGYYSLYLNGEDISLKTTSAWKGDNLILTHESFGTKYVLENYANRDDNSIRAVEKSI